MALRTHFNNELPCNQLFFALNKNILFEVILNKYVVLMSDCLCKCNLSVGFFAFLS